MKPGDVVAGYRVEAALGAGAMGAVFRARELETQRVVAIKVLHPGADPAARSRFAREGLAMARLNHPHLLGVHAALEDLPEPVLVLEFAPQGSLASRLQAGPLAPELAIRWIGELASGLAVAHAEGILHRDLKPENVLFDEEGRPKLADFGLARVEDEARLTATHEVLGTPLYMAPEQALGEAASEAVDVYALGAVLYHCLTGRPPLLPGATLLGLLHRLQSEEPPRLASLGVEVPPRVDALSRSCLAKDPRLRPSAAELARDLTTEDEEGDAARLLLPLVATLVGLGAVAAVLVGVLLTRSKPLPRVATPASPTSTPASSPTPSLVGPALEFRLVDLGPEVVAAAPRDSVLREAAASLAAVSSLELAQLYHWAGQSALLVGEHKDYVLSAALSLARAGHSYGVVRLGAHRAGHNPSLPLSDEARRWLESAARVGDREALFELGCANELRSGNRPLAQAYRYLGLATRALRPPEALQRDLARDPRGAEFKGLTPTTAWRRVWRITRPVQDPAWLKARRELSEEPRAAVEAYLVLLDGAQGARREALAEELIQAAERAWIPLLRNFTPRLVELHSAVSVEPDQTLEQARAQAERVLERVRWSRGVLLRLEFRIQLEGWGAEAKPQTWVLAELEEALRLLPGSPLGLLALFRANLWDEEEALRQGRRAHALTRHGRERSRLRDAQRYALWVAYRQRWTSLEIARGLGQRLPGSGSVSSRWRALLIEHLALRRGQTTRAQIELLREEFLQGLDEAPSRDLGPRQRADFQRRLKALPIRDPQPAPSPTPG
tara:strand:+ start:2910 stop:5267 length:2358 start_codon:yes stop_codon:yes gene_type:complete